MAGELRPGTGRPGQKRQQDTAGFRPESAAAVLSPPLMQISWSQKAGVAENFASILGPWRDEWQGSSSYDLSYDLHRDDVPYRVYGYQRIPPLINQVPTKFRRTFVGLRVKSGCSSCKASRSRPLTPEQIKPVHIEELYSIRGELSQIKAQVDRLLESVERMDQHRAQAAGIKDSNKNRVPGNEGCSCRTTEAQQEPRGQSIHLEADNSEGRTATEQAVQNQSSDQEGSQ